MVARPPVAMRKFMAQDGLISDTAWVIAVVQENPADRTIRRDRAAAEKSVTRIAAEFDQSRIRDTLHLNPSRMDRRGRSDPRGRGDNAFRRLVESGAVCLSADGKGEGGASC
jgi:hypothetical protein